MNVPSNVVQAPDRLCSAIIKAMTSYDDGIDSEDMNKCVDTFTSCVKNDPRLVENLVKNAINCLHSSQHTDDKSNDSTLLPFPNVLNLNPCDAAATGKELKDCRPSLKKSNVVPNKGKGPGSSNQNKNIPSLNFPSTSDRTKGSKIKKFKISINTNPRRRAAYERPPCRIAKLKSFYKNLRIIRKKRSSLNTPGPSNRVESISRGSNINELNLKIKLQQSHHQSLVYEIELHSQFGLFR